jgi:hypothetical protein
MELPLKPKEGKEGGQMKKQALRTFIMLTFVVLLTAVTVSAQSERISVINIPFSFNVGQKTLPAGEYTLEPNRKDFDKVWLIQSRDGHATALFTTIPVQASETQEEARLVFHKYGDQYFLSQIWEAGGNSGRELLLPSSERQLAKNGSERQMVVLTRDPSRSN